VGKEKETEPAVLYPEETRVGDMNTEKLQDIRRSNNKDDNTVRLCPKN
jgi:hypothetical protein